MKQFNKLVYPYMIWAFIMIVLPMVMIVLYAFTKCAVALFKDGILHNHHLHCHRVSNCLFHGKNEAEKPGADRIVNHAANVDQHAGAHLCLEGHPGQNRMAR